MLALKKLVVWFTLVCFIFSVTGCAELGIHPVPIGDSRQDYSLTPDEQANANQAAQVFNTPPPQGKPLIYDPDRPSEARAMLKHFKAVAKQYRGRTGNFSESEKQEIVDAILPLANYLAAVEASQKGIYVVPPGQKQTLNLEGYCLDKRKGTPQQNEKMRLVPADTLTGTELKPIYQKLLRFARNNSKRVNHADMQGILWGIREIANGHNTQSRFLSEQQLQILNEAAPEAATILQRMQFEGKIKVIVFEKADKWFKEATKNLPIPLPSIERLTNGGSPEEIVRETTGTVANNQLGRFFNQIPDATARMTVEQTLAHLTGLPIGGTQGINGEYTLLSPNVAAKTNASGNLGAKIEIVNNSAGIFPFEAESCVAQSQRPAQRIALQPLAYTIQVNPKHYQLVSDAVEDGLSSLLTAAQILLLFTPAAGGIVVVEGATLAARAGAVLLQCIKTPVCRNGLFKLGKESEQVLREAARRAADVAKSACGQPDPEDKDKDKKQCPDIPDNNPADSWANQKTLKKHFREHGSDFGAANEREYVEMANDFFRQAKNKGLPTKVDANGEIRIYDSATNTFGTYNGNGKTITFYKPDPANRGGNKTNQEYWETRTGEPCKW